MTDIEHYKMLCELLPVGEKVLLDGSTKRDKDTRVVRALTGTVDCNFLRGSSLDAFFRRMGSKLLDISSACLPRFALTASVI